MNDITANQARVLLTLLKDYRIKYNANSLSKTVGLSAMGTLKILRRFHEQGILRTETIGRAIIYRIDYSSYVKQFLAFLLRKEAEEAEPRVKRWVTEMRKLESTASICVLFGSVLRSDSYSDVDALVVFEQARIKELNALIRNITSLTNKDVHLVKQAEVDLVKNLSESNPVILNAMRGVVVFGYEEFVEVMERVTPRE
ncbi:MAG: nucleotidyltransferase domain-containing protein [Candidatus Woesearchaeota archaeon]